MTDLSSQRRVVAMISSVSMMGPRNWFERHSPTVLALHYSGLARLAPRTARLAFKSNPGDFEYPNSQLRPIESQSTCPNQFQRP